MASLFRGDVYRRDPELVENWSGYYVKEAR